jgi:CRISPR/Cas system-associated exonuclease Cas4 (RecB family)
VIRASEIGEYVFCHRAWWLRHVAGYESANVREMAEGTATHARHGLLVSAASGLRILALVLLAAAVVWVVWVMLA